MNQPDRAAETLGDTAYFGALNKLATALTDAGNTVVAKRHQSMHRRNHEVAKQLSLKTRAPVTFFDLPKRPIRRTGRSC